MGGGAEPHHASAKSPHDTSPSRSLVLARSPPHRCASGPSHRRTVQSHEDGFVRTEFTVTRTHPLTLKMSLVKNGARSRTRLILFLRRSAHLRVLDARRNDAPAARSRVLRPRGFTLRSRASRHPAAPVMPRARLLGMADGTQSWSTTHVRPPHIETLHPDQNRGRRRSLAPSAIAVANAPPATTRHFPWEVMLSATTRSCALSIRALAPPPCAALLRSGLRRVRQQRVQDGHHSPASHARPHSHPPLPADPATTIRWSPRAGRPGPS